MRRFLTPIILFVVGLGVGFEGWLIAKNPHEHVVFLVLVLAGAVVSFLALLPVKRKTPSVQPKPLVWPAAVGAGLGMPLISAISHYSNISASAIYTSLFGFGAGVLMVVCCFRFYSPPLSRFIMRLRDAQPGVQADVHEKP